VDETGHRPTTGPDSTVVAIPIYRRELTQGEAALVRSTISVSRKPVFVAPSDLPLGFYQEHFPDIETVLTDPRHLSSIRHYSEWLTTPAFYDLWSDYSWLIVCQTDAVLTADPWTRIEGEPDWDYVGAPWNPPIKVVTFGNRILVRSPAGQHRGPAWVGIVGRTLQVGNGGLSMRRIEVFRRAARDMTAGLTQETRHHIHEDVLWAAYGPRFGARIAAPAVARDLFYEVVRSRDQLQGDPLPDVVGLHGLTSWPLPSGRGGPR
jgi:hypothetical protein